ncbi:hypothetical protein [Ensifer canadensis]
MLAGFCLLRFGLGLFYRVPANWQMLVALLPGFGDARPRDL